jgi:hypothetical protein
MKATVLKVIAYCGVLGVGLLQGLATRQAMQSDGISYLDMGDAIVRRDWGMAINGYWSPLYPLLLGITLRIAKPSAYFQFTVVHLLNFAIYAFAFACFDFFLGSLLADRAVNDGESPSRQLPRWLFFALGYLAFARLALSMITLERVSPDMLMAAFLFLACGLLLRLRAGPASIRPYVLLGAILGVGYLAKAPMFPLSFVILGTAAFAQGGWRRRLPGVLAALLVFLSIAGVYIGVVSKTKGRLLISDSGRLNYLLLVNHVCCGWYFQDIGTAGGRYIHPVRRIHESPPIYEFANPIKGTQPIWYDPSYWNEGAIPRLDTRAWIASIGDQLHEYFNLVWHRQRLLLIGFLLLACVTGIATLWWGLREHWPILVLALAGFAMYSLSLVQGRYVAVFFMLICALWLRAAGKPIGLRASRVRTAIALAVTVALGASLARSTSQVTSAYSSFPIQWQVAEDLKRLGVPKGAQVARIGGVYSADWARLAGFTVVAEVPRDLAQSFWSSPDQEQAEVIRVFRSLGVKAVVAAPPAKASQTGTEWRRLVDGTFYAVVF